MPWESRGNHLVWPNASTGHVEDFLRIKAPHSVEFTDAAGTVAPAVPVLLSVHKLTGGQPQYIGDYVTVAQAMTAAGHAP